MNDSETVTHILDLAQELVQKRGYNGFSYRDLSEQIGIKTSSIHYHFPSKGDLGRALVVRYRASFQTAFVQIDAHEDDLRMKLRLYVELFRQTLEDEGKVCLCGMLSTDYQTLPPPVSEEVQRFFVENEAWLTRVLEEGQRAHIFRQDIDAAKEAAALLAGLEGAMMVARAFGDVERFTQTSSVLLAALEA
ncbi:MAG TPA: TetR/AcrR family transcriptional regulator [Ktedonobacteraceae bacterium]|nr:TetR/AcrR family transcriptional regulator [Ktedonobacteraceae bacterium]